MSEVVQEVRNSYSIFEKFMDYCPIISLLMDDRGMIIFANKSFFKTFHLSKKVIGMNVLEVLPIDFAKNCLKNNELLLELNFPINTVERAVLNDNKEYIFDMCKFPVKFDGASLIGCWARQQ
jgi:PAS domain-containing protein